MKETYYFTLKHYVKEKNKHEYLKGIKEFDKFLDGYYEYEFYFRCNPLTIADEIANKLKKEEREFLAEIQESPNLINLFNDFKFKKCDDLFMNFKFNSTLFDQCKETILDREKMFHEYEKGEFQPTRKQWILYSLGAVARRFYNNFKLSEKEFYFVSVLVFFLSLFAIVIPYYNL